MAKTSPTQRTMDYYRNQGWAIDICERWLGATRTRKDLFGFADLIAMQPDHLPMMIQATSTSNLQSRIKKMKAEPNVQIALRSGFSVIAIGWRKYKNPEDGKWWRPTVFEITLSHFD